MAEEYTYEGLKSMTVAQLREVAKGLDHEAVKGYSQLRKDQLLPAVCEALGVQMQVKQKVKGLNKREIKKQIKVLKGDRDTAIEAHDSARLKTIRRKIHKLKRKIHKAMV